VTSGTFPEEQQAILTCQLSIVECHHKKEMEDAEPYLCVGVGEELGTWSFTCPSPSLCLSHHLLLSFSVSACFAMLYHALIIWSFVCCFVRFSETSKNPDPYCNQSQLLRRTLTLFVL